MIGIFVILAMIASLWIGRGLVVVTAAPISITAMVLKT
jgi:hypothetical protein